MHPELRVGLGGIVEEQVQGKLDELCESNAHLRGLLLYLTRLEQV